MTRRLNGLAGRSRSIRITSRMSHAILVAALALTGHDAEAREALQRYLALPSTGPLKTIAAWKAYYESAAGRRSTPASRRNERIVRRPAQGRDAGGVSGRDSGEGGLDARQGLPLRAVKRRRQVNGTSGERRRVLVQMGVRRRRLCQRSGAKQQSRGHAKRGGLRQLQILDKGCERGSRLDREPTVTIAPAGLT